MGNNKICEPNILSILTHREQDILELFSSGHSYKEVAIILSISIHTVNQHIRVIYEKLKCRNKTQAINTALRLDLINRTIQSEVQVH